MARTTCDRLHGNRTWANRSYQSIRTAYELLVIWHHMIVLTIILLRHTSNGLQIALLLSHILPDITQESEPVRSSTTPPYRAKQVDTIVCPLHRDIEQIVLRRPGIELVCFEPGRGRVL